MSSKKSETAVYGWNPPLLKFYQCRVDVLKSQIFLRGQISLAAMFVITDFCWKSSWTVYDLYSPAFIFVQQSLCGRYLSRHEGALRDYPNAQETTLITFPKLEIVVPVHVRYFNLRADMNYSFP